MVFATDGRAGAAGIWNYFIDAHDGSIVDMFNNLQTAVVEASGPGGNARVKRTWNMNLDVTQNGASYIMKTTQYETTNAHTGQDYAGTSLTNYNSTAPSANDGHGLGEIIIKMLKDWQGYNSIDNIGLVLVSNIHAGQQLGTEDNAAWNGSSMNPGDGDGTQFFNFTGAQYHSNLTYSGQPGGMNESFSDIAGPPRSSTTTPRRRTSTSAATSRQGQHVHPLDVHADDGRHVDRQRVEVQVVD